MSEETNSSESASETAKPESTPRPGGTGRNVWLMIVAIVVVIALVATAFVFLPDGEKKEKLTAIIMPDSLEVDAGMTKNFTVIVMLGEIDITNVTETTKLFWSVTPSSIGSFLFKAKPEVQFKAAIVGGTGTVKVNVTYQETPESEKRYVEVTKTVTVLPPYLDSVSVTPGSKTIPPPGNATFTATAVSSVGIPISGVAFNWSLTTDAGMTSTLNATTGTTVRLDSGAVEGNATLTATGSYAGKTKSGTATIRVGPMPPRSMDYVWYDMFNVPIGSWYAKRFVAYGQEEPISDTYPYLFLYHDDPPGNLHLYSLMRLNMTGRNVTEVNTNTNPRFFPILSETERGGNVDIDWYMQYLTSEELQTQYPSFASQDDGWIIVLNGTVKLDKQAAKMILNMTEVGYSTFDRWWSENSGTVNQRYSQFLVTEFARLSGDIAYESYYQLFTFGLDASKVGTDIVLRYDLVTWGMETLMLRWLHEAFLPIEMWYEDMHFRMKIMPEWSTVDIDTAVTYALYATIPTNSIGAPEVEHPCWVMQFALGDAVESTIEFPHSEMDPYLEQKYLNLQPDSPLYGTYMQYDYVPAAWNLAENETMKILWPLGNQTFRYRVAQGVAINISEEMVVRYSEPMAVDFPGKVAVDNNAGEIKFTGPMDIYNWSKTQTTYPYLQGEWERLGGELLPYGLPWVEFETKDPVRIFLKEFEITMQNSAPAGDNVTFTVRAINNYGSTYYKYNGTVNFTSTDPAAILPDNFTFNPVKNNGVVTVSALSSGAFFQTLGAQTLTVTNVSATGVRQPQQGNKTINVLAKRDANAMQVDVYYIPAVGVPEDVKVTVFDQYGSVFLNYTGTVTFSSNRTDLTLPSNYDFQLTDQGVHTIDDAVTFNAVGWYSLNASDSVNPLVKGSQTNIWVVSSPEVIHHFNVSGIRNMLGKQKSDVRVTAYDQYDKVFKRYTGTIHFSADKPGGVFPADYTFLESDEGFKLFSKAVSFTVSEDTVFNVTVADTVVPAATGWQSNIVITYKPASQTTRMYDFFQQPWGEWWYWRWPSYATDIILTNEPGNYTFVYTPKSDGMTGIIMAPYRWNITATNLSQISVHNPEFMPAFGTPNVAGARAQLTVYFEYLSWNWWNNYWVPVWHMPTAAMDAQIVDGYYPGLTYNITLNRAAAEEWLGMPQTADPMNWWNINGKTYMDKWDAWILNEGNVRLNIWPGYEWPYTPMGTKMKMSVKPNGDLYLQIGHMGSGYEILMLRWMTEMNICTHEGYYEDMLYTVDYYSDWIDFRFDAVVQYSLRAVKATEGSGTEGAWAWDPLLVDYVPTEGTPGGLARSTFDPWTNLTYTSNNAGDPAYGYDVGYDSGKSYFNLTDYQTFIIQLPKGNNNIGFNATTIDPMAIVNIIISGYPGSPPGSPPAPNGWDYSAYTSIMYNGAMSLGYYYTGGVDLDSMYDPIANTITMHGPLNFENTHHANGALYFGAPWIEFNVTMPMGAGGTSLPSHSVPTPPAGLTTEPATTTVSLETAALISVVSGTLVVIATVAVISRRKEDKED